MNVTNDYFKGIHQIIRTGHWITDQVSIALKDFQITEPQYNVLKILKGRKKQPVTVQEIQNDMIQRTSNVTRIIDKLLDKNLVNRCECPANRRKMDITITDKGEQFLVQLDKKVAAFHKPMAKNISEKEIEVLTKLMIKLKGK